jgi:hypothetical protein
MKKGTRSIIIEGNSSEFETEGGAPFMRGSRRTDVNHDCP